MRGLALLTWKCFPPPLINSKAMTIKPDLTSPLYKGAIAPRCTTNTGDTETLSDVNARLHHHLCKRVLKAMGFKGGGEILHLFSMLWPSLQDFTTKAWNKSKTKPRFNFPNLKVASFTATVIKVTPKPPTPVFKNKPEFSPHGNTGSKSEEQSVQTLAILKVTRSTLKGGGESDRTSIQ